MTLSELGTWSARFCEFVGSSESDSAHDLGHLRRVVAAAMSLARHESAALEIVIPAAWLHDCVLVPKDSPERSRASALAGDRAVEFLHEVGYPVEFLPAVHHCIEAHSFSAGIPPRTIEARVVQDADRLDALGAIGIARCFAVGGALQRPLYAEEDPFCVARLPDDSRFCIDHFFQKLFQIVETMTTSAGREEASRRARYMRDFLATLDREIHPDDMMPDPSAKFTGSGSIG